MFFVCSRRELTLSSLLGQDQGCRVQGISGDYRVEQVCFVIQPFDFGVYDSRYAEVYKPAIEAAGFQAYRVDEDPSASVPIEHIESGIRDAAVCFAEITEARENVWFELGLAIAHDKEVCLVCSSSRHKFPFDVQHRQIIVYESSIPSDFAKLSGRITSRLQALGKKLENRSVLAKEIVQIGAGGGLLSDHEIACLGVLAGGDRSEDISMSTVRREMGFAGYTGVASNAAIRKLERTGFVAVYQAFDAQGQLTSPGISLEPNGWNWVEENLDRFLLKQAPGTEIPF